LGVNKGIWPDSAEIAAERTGTRAVIFKGAAQIKKQDKIIEKTAVGCSIVTVSYFKCTQTGPKQESVPTLRSSIVNGHPIS
jgi:hypothetical protein